MNNRGVTATMLAAYIFLAQITVRLGSAILHAPTAAETHARAVDDRKTHCQYAKDRYPTLEAQGSLTHDEAADLIKTACAEVEKGEPK